MSSAFRRLLPLAVLALVLGACKVYLAKTNEALPLGYWTVKDVVSNRETRVDLTGARIRTLGRPYFFGAQDMRYPDGIVEAHCVHGGYGLYIRRIDQEDAFDAGDLLSFDAKEAGIKDKSLYEVKSHCGLKIFLSLDKRRMLVLRDKELHVLEREPGPFKPDPTPAPTAEPAPTPKPFITPLPLYQSPRKPLN